MAIKITFKIGENITLQAEGESPKAAFEAAGKFSQFPQSCGHCNSPALGIEHRVTPAKGGGKEYAYFHIVCSSCGARCDLGQNQDAKNLFFSFKKSGEGLKGVKKGFYKAWDQDFASGDSQQSSEPVTRRTTAAGGPSVSADDHDEDDIPF